MPGGDSVHSLWSETSNLPFFAPLTKSLKTDVLIIGGGITGILCAYYLKQAGVPYLLVEANTLCSGITKDTTAKITSQHGLLYANLLKKSQEKAKLYLEANEAALDEYRRLCSTISCDFQEKPSYVYSLTSEKKIEQELHALRTLGFPAEYSQHLPIPLQIAGAVSFPRQAQFHPLRFLAEIARGLNIFEHTKVQELIGTTAITNHGRIHADKIIVTTHFPMLNKHGSYFLKLYQHRSYVLALEHAGPLSGMYVDENEKGLSFRTYRNFLLLGGGGHRTGKPGGNWNELEAFARKHYPKATPAYRFATQDCMSLDSIPYIGPYSKQTPRLYVATGFHKWGMTSSMVAATLLRDLILNRPNPYAKLYSPSRKILTPQLFVNAFESTTNLLTPSKKRCPHLGCALKWNPAEHTWDCPCHGSRFSESGQLLDNPATDDLCS